MITKQRSHYIQFLAQNHSVLLLSDRNIKEYESIREFFTENHQRNLQEVELENINITLMVNKIEIVILDTTIDTKIAKKFLESLHKYNIRIVILTILKNEINEDILFFTKQSDSVIFDGFSEEELKGKLVELLSVFYTILSIGRRDNLLKDGSNIINDFDNFLDTYEGNSLFIVDELMELNLQLKNGELSKELLSDIGQKCFEIAEVFNKYEPIKDVHSSFRSLGEFLTKLDFDSIDYHNLNAFDYLVEIIYDVNKSIMDLFVDRIFKDVNIFKASLERNIDFFKIKLFPNENKDLSELDFF